MNHWLKWLRLDSNNSWTLDIAIFLEPEAYLLSHSLIRGGGVGGGGGGGNICLYSAKNSEIAI